MTESELAQPFIEALGPWRDYALQWPLKALHEALDPQFRRSLALPEGLILSAVLVVMAVDGIPVWTLDFGLYSPAPGALAERPAVALKRWPGVYRELVKKVAASLIFQIGGQGDPQLILRPVAVCARRALTGVEARTALAPLKYPILNRPDTAHGE